MKLPTLFISHGGGPWPFMEDSARDYAATAAWLAQLPATLPAQPAAILSVSGHWEEPYFTVSAAAQPPMIYDYYNFPEHTYRVKYPAPGAPELASRVGALLAAAGVDVHESKDRGFDHGTFVPLSVMYSKAEIPVVSLSLRENLDASEHIRMGAALEPLREQGVLIVGSGLSYHNLRMFRNEAQAGPVSRQFEAWLTDAVADADAASRNHRLSQWAQAPSARLAHPREEHLIPLMVAAGAAGESRGRRVFRDEVSGVSMASYQFDA